MDKGWSGLILLILVLLVTVFGGGIFIIEYFRRNPFSVDEIKNFQNILMLPVIPVAIIILSRFLWVLIDEKKERVKLISLQYANYSPTEEKEIDPSPPLSQGEGNQQITNNSDRGVERLTLSKDHIKKGIITFITLNNGLNFKDQSSISRIVSFIPGSDKDSINLAVRELYENGIIVKGSGKNGSLLILPENNPVPNQDKLPVNNPKNTMESMQFNRIVELIKAVYPEEDWEENIILVQESINPSEYPKTIKDLEFALEEMKTSKVEFIRQDRGDLEKNSVPSRNKEEQAA